MISQNPRVFFPRRAFTLVEMLVALGVFSVLLVVIMVPIKLSLDSFALSRVQSQAQSQLGATAAQIETDLRRAIRVFPNAGVNSFYLRSPTNLDVNNLEACAVGNQRFSNLARLDMILMARDQSGNPVAPPSPAGTIVTYYVRRPDISKPYSFSENPLLIFRAETPFRFQNNDGTLGGPFPAPDLPAADNATLDATINCSTPANGNRAGQWRMHTKDGETNLEPLTRVDALMAFGSHQLAISRDLALVAPNAYAKEDSTTTAFPSGTPSAPLLMPETVFSTFDTNGDGKIDRVSFSLSAQSFAAQSANSFRNNRPSGSVLRVSRTIDLPNIQ